MVELVGREADIEFLLDAWAAARRGGRTVVLLGGEAGIGRTEVVGTLTERVRAQGAAVAVAHAVDLPGQTPCWTVLSALRRSLAGGAHSVPEARGGGHDAIPTPGSGPEVAGDLADIGGLLAGLSRAGPVLLVVEDVHLGDSSYVDLLHYVLAEPGSGPLLVVATYCSEAIRRTDALRSALTRLSTHRDVRARDLLPLPRAAVRTLVHRSAPGDAALAASVWRRSAGNPTIVRASLRAQDGQLSVGLRALALTRIETLSAAGRAVGRALAVAGRPLPHRALGAMADLPDAELSGALRDAVDAGVVVVADDLHSLANGLLGEVLEDEVLPGERASLRSRLRDASGAPDDSGTGPGQIAPGGADAVEHAPEQDVVLEACLAAAARSGDGSAVLAAQETLAGLLCGPLGRVSDGVALARRVLEDLPADRQGEPAALGLRAVLADGLVRRGCWPEATSLLEAADTPATVRMLVVRGRLALERGDTEAAAEALATAGRGLVGRDDDARTADAVVELRTRIALARGDRDAVRHLVTRRLAAGRGGPWTAAPMLWLGLRAEAGTPDPETLGRLRRHLEVIEHRVARADTVLRRAAAAHVALCRAEEGRVVGRSRASEWEEVMTGWQALGEAPLVAYCRWRQGEALLEDGQPGPAADVLRSAAELARTLGAVAAARAVQQTLDRALRDPGARPSVHPTGGVETLTAREEQVLAELSHGLTNRVIGRRLRISEKTVEVHVTHILAKLGARTRLEASVVWHREVPVPAPLGAVPSGTPVTRLSAARASHRREVG